MKKSEKNFMQEEKNLEKVSGGMGTSATGGAVNVSTNLENATITGAAVTTDNSTDNSTHDSGNHVKTFTPHIEGTNSVSFGHIKF